MTKVNVHEARTQLLRLLDQAMAGEEVIIMRSGRRLVRLTPVESATVESATVESVPVRRVLGTAKGDFEVADDFNDPLSEDVLAEFER